MQTRNFFVPLLALLTHTGLEPVRLVDMYLHYYYKYLSYTCMPQIERNVETHQ